MYLSKDLGSQDYKYCFDATGKPFIEAIANKKGGVCEAFPLECRVRLVTEEKQSDSEIWRR